MCQTSRERLRSRFEHSQLHHDLSHNDVFLRRIMESETLLSLSRSAECRNAIYRVNGRVTAQPTQSGGDCFSRLLCLPLDCAESVLHILCLWWLKLCSQWKSTHWVQGFVTSCFCLIFDSSTHPCSRHGREGMMSRGRLRRPLYYHERARQRRMSQPMFCMRQPFQVRPWYVRPFSSHFRRAPPC